MKKSLQRTLSLAVALVLLTATLSGCTPPAKAPEVTPTPVLEATPAVPSATPALPEAATRVFTDSLGREVTLPADLQRIAPSGTLTQIVLYTLAPDRMVGWSTKPTDEMKKYFGEQYTALPTFGTFYGKKANLNLEALIAADPQVVVDMGEVKGSAEDMKADLDGLQKQLNIPVVFLESTLETTGESYRMLGKLLGLEQEAAPLADYCDETVAFAREKAATLTEADKVRVYCGEGEDGLTTNPVGSFHCEVLELVGAANVVDLPVTSGSGGSQVSMEQLLLWAPDLILIGPDSIYSTIATDPLWQDLTAVQEKKVYEIPAGPYQWTDRPPAVNRLLGIKWLGNLLYPDLFGYDMREETRNFYSLFYHCDLTEDQITGLLQNATPGAK